MTNLTFIALHLAWVPVVGVVAVLLGLVCVTVNALWEVFRG